MDDDLCGRHGSTAIIIVDYACESIRTAVQSAVESCVDPADRVIVVDNSTRELTRSAIGDLVDEAKLELVESQVNLGFAGGVRLGVAHAGAAKFIALLNPDARATPNWIVESSRRLAATTNVWAVAPLIVDMNAGAVASAGVVVDAMGWPADALQSQDVDTARALLASSLTPLGPSGGAMVARRDAYESLGGLDDEYFAFLEDVDLAWRARARGWDVIFASDLVVFHEGGGTFGSRPQRKARLMARNRWRLVARNASGAQVPLMVIGNLLHLFAALIFGRRDGTSRATLGGHLTGMRQFAATRRAGAERRRDAVPMSFARPDPWGQLRARKERRG